MPERTPRSRGTFAGCGAKKDATDKSGFTPLMLACMRGHLEIVEMLVAAGANKEMQNQHGFTPLMLTCQAGHREVVLLLLAHGALPHSACDLSTAHPDILLLFDSVISTNQAEAA